MIYALYYGNIFIQIPIYGRGDEGNVQMEEIRNKLLIMALHDFKKLFAKIKKNCKMEKMDIKKIRSKMKELNPEMYDVMSCEKGSKFDLWIKDIYGRLSTKELDI